jgi:hypothetical protein
LLASVLVRLYACRIARILELKTQGRMLLIRLGDLKLAGRPTRLAANFISAPKSRSASLQRPRLRVVRVLHSDDDVPVAVPVPFATLGHSRDERTGQETSWLTMPDFFGTG